MQEIKEKMQVRWEGIWAWNTWSLGLSVSLTSEDSTEIQGSCWDPQTLSKLCGSESHNLKINHKDNFADGIRFAQDVIDGTASIIILKDDGHIIAARDIAKSG